MLPIQLFRQNKELVLEGLKKKNFKEMDLVDTIINLDERRRALQVENDSNAAAANSAAKAISQHMVKGEKDQADVLKAQVTANKERTKQIAQDLADLENELNDTLVRLPNLPHSSVPAGKTPEENEVVRSGGDMPSLGSNNMPHWELADKYKLIDFELGNKITGSGFPVFMGQGARLQRALINYFLNFNMDAGYKEYCPPFMVNTATAYGTGQLPDKEGQMYHCTEDGFYLIPTAEVPITNIYRDVIIPETELPVKMTAYSPCFRREAGSYGKDVRGLNRVHQFDKVEIVQLSRPNESYDLLEGMVNHVEKLLQSLELPYRILRLCGGDMSFTSALTYDFEVYSAAQERWLEVSSVSNFEVFQANRMKIRYKGADGKTQLVHTLNGSSLALPRIMACLLENNQTAEGIKIPTALQPYFGKDMIS
ncbi:serine--tRNA ligase [Flavipsychrobacter stenotrophus]|uniref:Serine--tRNA ligase n=1 Tax=Flavipsychrobacter stenotrophus TaxID=2077091 RepID=A0A2S7SV15_9BACT|nr:serine--tRNA ligase [Flavipsychrobacter stenotrophus]PQJ10558.1 serine--tRNA ligase [Flavipsychrobacter stenotrophus]